jgi:hypothetical protein
MVGRGRRFAPVGGALQSPAKRGLCLEVHLAKEPACVGAGGFGNVTAFEFEADLIDGVTSAELVYEAENLAGPIQGWAVLVEDSPRDVTSFPLRPDGSRRSARASDRGRRKRWRTLRAGCGRAVADVHTRHVPEPRIRARRSFLRRASPPSTLTRLHEVKHRYYPTGLLDYNLPLPIAGMARG